MKEDIKRLGGLHPFASEPPAAPLPRHSEAEAFWYSRRRGLRPRCVGQYQLSFFRCRAGPPPLRLTSLMGRRPPISPDRPREEGKWERKK